MTNVAIPTSPKSTILSYQDVENLLYTVGGKMVLNRKVQRNTYLERCPTGIQLRLHRTAVITWHRDDTLTLKTGGWFTMTTRDRLNGWLPDHGDGRALWVVPFHGYWHVGTVWAKDDGHRWATNEKAKPGYVPFEEGMNLDMITCTLVSGDKDLTDDYEWNAEIERLIKLWFTQLGSHTLAVELPDETGWGFETHLIACLNGNRIPANFYWRVAVDLGFHSPERAVMVWERDKRLFKAHARKWLRAKLLRGSKSRGRAIKNRKENG